MLSCRVRDAGCPQCPLGSMGCTSVQLRGTSFYNIQTANMGKIPTPIQLREGQFDTVFIVDMPGQEEDVCGIPFQNRAGDLFTQFVNGSGLDPAKVYVTYTVKCKPPYPRKPSVSEINVCKGHVVDELLYLKPKVVVLLGDMAMRVFNLTGKGGLKNIHGTIWNLPLPDVEDSPTFCVVPIYHPASVMYSTSSQFKDMIQSDYCRVADIINHGSDSQTKEDYKIPYRLLSTMEDIHWLADTLATKEVFAFDTESDKLPWSKAPLLCVSFAWEDKPGNITSAVLPFYTHDPSIDADFKGQWFWPGLPYSKIIAPLKQVFESAQIAKVAHNIKYDINVMRWWTGIRIDGPAYDTMLMHHMLNENPPHDLEHLADIEFRIGDYSADKRAITGQGKVLRAGYSCVPDATLWQYTANDAQSCLNLFNVYYQRLIAQNLLPLYLEESMPLSYALAEAEWWGNKIDMKVVNDIKTRLEKRQNVLFATMREQAGNQEFNPNSHPQVAEVLKKSGYANTILDPTKSSNYTVDKNMLTEIANTLPFAANVLEFRSNMKVLKTYIERVLNDLDEDGRLRYSWLIHGTKTARLSCSLLHQVPRKTEKVDVRKMFIVPKDCDYTYADFSQIELRAMAIYAKDQVMLDLFKNGEDIHTASAAAALNIPIDQVSSFNRQVGKAINFGLVFGSEGYQLVEKLEYEDLLGHKKRLDFKTIQLFLERTRKKFFKITEFCQDVPLIAMANGGVVETVFGRRRRLGTMLNDPRDSIRKHAEREAVNFKIQSTASAITVRTIIEVWRYINELIKVGKLKEGDVKLICTVHDSIAYETKKHLTQWFRGVLRSIAEREIPELDNYKFPVNIGIGDSWSSAEDDSKEN